MRGRIPGIVGISATAKGPTMSTVQRVAIVVFEGLQALDATGPAEVFAQANRLGGAYEIELVGLRARTTSGLTLGPVVPFDAHRGPLDTLMVAGGQGIARAQHDPELIAWVRAASLRSRRVTSVCSGAFVLARAGLLDGRRATTHWDSCA